MMEDEALERLRNIKDCTVEVLKDAVIHQEIPKPPTKIPFEWEVINEGNDCYTCRAKVFGGWLISTQIDSELSGYMQHRESIVFIPDPFHEWSVDE